MKPGPALGKMLEALLELVLADPSLNEREALLRTAREILGERPPAGLRGRDRIVVASRACAAAW